MNEILSERFKALGIQLGTAKLKTEKGKKIISAIEELGLKEVETIFGTAYFAERLFPYSSNQAEGMKETNKYHVLSRLVNIRILNSIRKSEIVYLDTETTGLVGGTGTMVFLIGLGHFSPDGFRVVQFFLDNPDNEVSFLSAVEAFLQKFKVMVTYNGKSFDIPLLSTRFILNNLVPSFVEISHLDFLFVARKLWGNRLPRRRLADLEVSILHIARTDEEISSDRIPEVYFDYLDTGYSELLPNVLYHNAKDIVSLASLMDVGAETTLNAKDGHEIDKIDMISVGRIFEDIHDEKNAMFIYENGLKKDLPKDIYNKTILRLGAMYKKKKDWNYAINLWEKLAKENIPACIELAKYYEHNSKELEKARIWTENAIRVSQNETDECEAEFKALKRRLDRIIRKMEKEVTNE